MSSVMEKTSTSTRNIEAPRGFLTRRGLTLAAVLALAISWGFLPEFTVVVISYIGLYALVAVGLCMLTGVGGMTSFGQAAFVGMGAIVMDGCRLDTGAMLAAGAMLTPGKHIPKGQLWTGRPATFRRDLSDGERAVIAEQTEHYVDNARRHRQTLDAAAPLP